MKQADRADQVQPIRLSQLVNVESWCTRWLKAKSQEDNKKYMKKNEINKQFT